MAAIAGHSETSPYLRMLHGRRGASRRQAVLPRCGLPLLLDPGLGARHNGRLGPPVGGRPPLVCGVQECQHLRIGTQPPQECCRCKAD